MAMPCLAASSRAWRWSTRSASRPPRRRACTRTCPSHPSPSTRRSSSPSRNEPSQIHHQPRRHPHRAGRREGPAVGRQLPRLRPQRSLRRHGVPPRHQGLHDPGWRLRARHEAKAHRGPDPERGQQRPEERPLHAGHGAHECAPLGHRAVLHQHDQQRLPGLQVREPVGLGLCGVRQGRPGPGRGRQDREGQDRRPRRPW
mmetsp:Transcript_22461/g.36943  ORF Transcript_22461/g.36943 Transcript_22461/m.36943 type:complete len:200 (-) Transcript_22461:219-818(-)